MSREPTRHQLSSKLAYEQKTPNFLLKLQRKVAGRGGADSEEEDYDAEFEDDGSGRPPIPRRPAIPERPDNDPGSAEEDVDDESPQVVVLKEGKHLSEREVQNEKRRGMFISFALIERNLSFTWVLAMGLPPIVDPPESSASEEKVKGKAKDDKGQGLTFSSGGKSGVAIGKKNTKRKVVGDIDEAENSKTSGAKVPSKKKAKKSDKKLLSFGDDDP